MSTLFKVCFTTITVNTRQPDRTAVFAAYLRADEVAPIVISNTAHVHVEIKFFYGGVSGSKALAEARDTYTIFSRGASLAANFTDFLDVKKIVLIFTVNKKVQQS